MCFGPIVRHWDEPQPVVISMGTPSLPPAPDSHGSDECGVSRLTIAADKSNRLCLRQHFFPAPLASKSTLGVLDNAVGKMCVLFTNDNALA